MLYATGGKPRNHDIIVILHTSISSVLTCFPVDERFINRHVPLSPDSTGWQICSHRKLPAKMAATNMSINQSVNGFDGIAADMLD